MDVWEKFGVITELLPMNRDCCLCVCVCVCVCLIMSIGWVAGLLLTGTGGCGFALGRMTGNRSVLVQSFTGMGRCGF